MLVAFVPSEADPGVYFLLDRSGCLQSALCVHVDDFYAWGLTISVAERVVADLRVHIALKVDMTPSLLLHMEVMVGEDGSTLSGQQRFIMDILKTYNLSDVYPCRASMEKGLY